MNRTTAPTVPARVLPDVPAKPEAVKIQQHLRTQFEVTESSAAGWLVTWPDGPTVVELARSLQAAGYTVDDSTNPYWTHVDSMALRRILRPATAVLLIIRRDLLQPGLSGPHTVSLPAGGLSARSPAEEVALALLLDNTTDLPADPEEMLGILYGLVDELGGITSLLQVCDQTVA